MFGLASKQLLAAPFIAIGAFWLAAAASSQGPAQLILPGTASLLTGIFLPRKNTKWIKPLMLVTSIYNIMILTYQAFASYILITIGLTLLGSLGLAGYTLAALLFLVLLAYGSIKLGEETSAPSPSSS
ncbi:MAG: hypothetical protein HYU39_02355 [Thaumarchaeota archaeon]|nr:hypothetical protein [Nitrososphaerota archaeon]